MAVVFKSDNVQKYSDIKDSIKAGLKVEDIANGSKHANIVEVEDHNAYYSNLPDGHTKKTVDELSKYNVRFANAAVIAVAEVAADVFLENKSVDTVDAKIGYFGSRDSIEPTVSRTKTYQNRLVDPENPGAEPAEITKDLVIKTTISTLSGDGYGLKAVRESMSREFSDLLKK